MPGYSIPLVDLAGDEGRRVTVDREPGQYLGHPTTVLLEDGTFTQDVPTLVDYGWPVERLKTKGLGIPPHPNMFAMRADIFRALGGYREDLVDRGYPQGEDSDFTRRWHKGVVAGRWQVSTERPTIYTFPQGKLCGHDVDFDPKGLFHRLSRAVDSNHFFRRYKREELVG
jgi:hypothetical protein